MRGDRVQRDRFLFPGGQILHLRHALRDIVVPDNHCCSGAQFIGALHPAFQITSISHFRAHPGCA